MKVIYHISNFHFLLSSLKGSIIFKDGNQLFFTTSIKWKNCCDAVRKHLEAQSCYICALTADFLDWEEPRTNLQEYCASILTFWLHNRQLELVETFSWDNSDNLLINFKTWNKKLQGKPFCFSLKFCFPAYDMIYLILHELSLLSPTPLLGLILIQSSR